MRSKISSTAASGNLASEGIRATASSAKESVAIRFIREATSLPCNSNSSPSSVSFLKVVKALCENEWKMEANGWVFTSAIKFKKLWNIQVHSTTILTVQQGLTEGLRSGTCNKAAYERPSCVTPAYTAQTNKPRQFILSILSRTSILTLANYLAHRPAPGVPFPDSSWY